MLTRIHVNQHVIKRNAQTGEREPALTVKTSRENRKAHTVKINGPSEVIYSPDKPLDCGARVWIETRAEVVVDRCERCQGVGYLPTPGHDWTTSPRTIKCVCGGTPTAT